ncbi:MAG TPA: hypothetical protein VEI07_05600 [Planctomycetaceae bacterium]|nr:hypothetical protein [Planctomycetaceae bacterium]
MPEVHGSKAGEERLYVPEYAGWKVALKDDWTKEYCFAQNPGEDFYHLLVTGEIFLQRGTEKYCLGCAVRHGYATHERGFWLHRPSSVEDQPADRSEE